MICHGDHKRRTRQNGAFFLRLRIFQKCLLIPGIVREREQEMDPMTFTMFVLFNFKSLGCHCGDAHVIH